MKLIVAHDGSECANEALDDLKRAGLPADAEALVVTIAEVWVPMREEGEVAPEIYGPENVASTPMSAHARQGLERAMKLAETAAANIRAAFPGWHVATRVYPESPTWGLLRAADETGPDLIVLGSHGRGALGRIILGSVSQKVLTEARCAVRIGRKGPGIAGAPVRIIVGVDGTPDSHAAVEEIAARSWPAGSTVRVIAVAGVLDLPVAPTLSYDVTEWVVEGVEKERNRMREIVDGAADTLRRAGLNVSAEVIDGAPVPVLLDAARQWGADAIFLGARGHRFMERFLLGSVSSAIAAKAECSVEVVRPRDRAAAEG